MEFIIAHNNQLPSQTTFANGHFHKKGTRTVPAPFRRNAKVKGQSSMELFTTIGMVIAFTIPVIMLFFSLTNAGYDSSAKSQAAAISRTIADNINEVYAQGIGAQRELLLNMPSSTDSLRVVGNDNAEGGEVVVKLTVSGKIFESASPVFAKVETFESRDSLNPAGPPRGPYRLKVVAQKIDNNQVEVRLYEVVR